MNLSTMRQRVARLEQARRPTRRQKPADDVELASRLAAIFTSAKHNPDDAFASRTVANLAPLFARAKLRSLVE